MDPNSIWLLEFQEEKRYRDTQGKAGRVIMEAEIEMMHLQKQGRQGRNQKVKIIFMGKIQC